MDYPIKQSFDEILLQLTRVRPPGEPVLPRKVLIRGERAGKLSSYVAGWLAEKRMEVIVLDGANRFDPYMVSSFARKALISPERLLKGIRIARVFTCFQMATLIGEKLIALVGAIHGSPLQKPWVILLGPISTFLDEDVPEREVRPLFERSLKKIEDMAVEGVSFLLFQSDGFSGNPPFPPSVSSRTDFAERGVGGLKNSKRIYLARRLFQFSNVVWKISLEDEGPRVILEKELTVTESLGHY